MNKYSVLLVVLLLAGSHAWAQSTPAKVETEQEKQETVKTEEKPATGVKVVPSARNRNAKPARVSSAKPGTARPGGNRPARNPRPSSRPARPGRN
jgi:hemolysin activation/secretion protein